MDLGWGALNLLARHTHALYYTARTCETQKIHLLLYIYTQVRNTYSCLLLRTAETQRVSACRWRRQRVIGMTYGRCFQPSLRQLTAVLSCHDICYRKRIKTYICTFIHIYMCTSIRTVLLTAVEMVLMVDNLKVYTQHFNGGQIPQIMS